jgi:DNA polymerase-1
MAAASLRADGSVIRREEISDVVAWVRDREAEGPVRWVWNDTPTWYDELLAAGVRVARCHDLRLCHAILRASASVAEPAAGALREQQKWDAVVESASDAAPALFEWAAASAPALPESLDDALAEFERQRVAMESSTDAGRLRLLTAAESAGALVAAELRAAGVPWDVPTHLALLEDTLGPRPAAGGMPARLDDAARRVRAALGDDSASLDSQPKLLRALHRAGVLAESTSRWELARFEHPAIAPLLEYKKLARLMSANGWAWLDEWVHDSRFRPVYVPAGVVTGRWASSGGGALQLPRQLRPAVRADPGWVLVVADVAQLEPRVLAGMSRDLALADAARGRDLYAGIVERSAVPTRAKAKSAMLGAMYGATSGESGRLVPALRRAFPRAMGLVDDAARIGEEGGVVSTWLGRTSPPPSSDWRIAQSRAGEAEAAAGDEGRAKRWARERGRFTRNFIVQGTAAEWALAWLADLRGGLTALEPAGADVPASRSGPAFERSPHLAFFLHDEIIIHTPAPLAEQVAELTRQAAARAGRLLFGDFPLDFPLDLRIAADAAKD